MRYAILFSILIYATASSAQTRRMTNQETGRTYSTQHQMQTVMPLLQTANQQLRMMDLEDAWLTLESAVAQNPNSPEALILRARLKKMMGMQSEANLDYQLANRLNPYVADLYGHNGSGGLLNLLSTETERSTLELNTYQKLNYYYEAMDSKVDIDKFSDEKFSELENVIALVESEQLEQAMSIVEKVLQSFSASAIAYDLKGLILYKQGNFEAATNAFKKAISIEPDYAIAWFNLGQLERDLGNYQQAIINLDKAIKLQEDLTKAYFERASVLRAMGKKESALADYNTVIDLHGKTYMEAYLNRGLTKKDLADFNGAIADFYLAIEEYPDSPDLRKNRGNLYLLFGLHGKAIDDYTKAIELDPNYAEAYFNRALAFFIQYDKISGCADLEKSVALGYKRAREVQIYFCGE